MNNEGAVLSRKNRFDKKQSNKKQGGEKNYGGLLIFLVFLSMFLLASAPVYGMMKNQPKLTKTTTSSSKSTHKQSQQGTSQKAAMSDDDADSAQSSSDASSSSAVASQNQDAAQAEDESTAVLAAGQTLYNFAITHNTSPANIVNLNPGLTVQNYSQYAGQSLKIK
ncbi:hypothetical protein LQZ24_01165 [Fructobacillus sp. M1-13]|uniref:LysM domain-containing protein n=1 Tax=Fructobacillus papyriferae TaxID=2713171 RepID=A0ABS5QRQ8_9LACO|nr:hypothetical protein [Fructobacillus papyriferae]MBS9334647.1 hypothetical protein [Fructobacillus papyriferae]MCD2158637.1 hypothetical protein [Fructobacillus papyriferae]